MRFSRYSPMLCNRRSLRLRWLRSAAALRRWVRVSISEIDSAIAREQRLSRVHSGTRIAVAVRTWQSVRSGFFPPMLLVELGQEQVADATEDQVPLDRPALAGLEVVQPQFALAILEFPRFLQPV